MSDSSFTLPDGLQFSPDGKKYVEKTRSDFCCLELVPGEIYVAKEIPILDQKKVEKMLKDASGQGTSIPEVKFISGVRMSTVEIGPFLSKEKKKAPKKVATNPKRSKRLASEDKEVWSSGKRKNTTRSKPPAGRSQKKKTVKSGVVPDADLGAVLDQDRTSELSVHEPVVDPDAFFAQAQTLRADIDELLIKHIMPTCRQFKYAHLDGSFSPGMESKANYFSVLEYLQRRMRRTPEPSHLTLPMLHNIVTRMLKIPKAHLEMGILACAVWGLNLCDKDDWFTAAGPATMKLHARFLGDGLELTCVPKHYLQQTSTKEFRNRIMLVGCVLAEDYGRELAKALKGSAASSAARVQAATSLHLQGVDALLDAVFAYSVQCRKWHVTSDVMKADQDTECAARVAYGVFGRTPELLARARQVHSLTSGYLGGMYHKFRSLDGDKDPAEFTVEHFSWMLVVANEVARMESKCVSPEIIPTDLVLGADWPSPALHVHVEDDNWSVWADVKVPSAFS
jgi:hypothetical protein